MFQIIITTLGLAIFEIVSSIDNAIVNAHVLKTLPPKFKRFFLVWGLLFAVVLVRGVLPLIIVWLANPSLPLSQIIGFIFSADPRIQIAIEQSKPILLLGGGVYLFLVFLSWLFLEEKQYAFLVEHFVHRNAVWFYGVTSIVLSVIIYISLHTNPILAFSASIGSTAFFITDGFKKNAEASENSLLNPNLSAISKVLYLELLDASFSIDGVIGAFAFTLSIPLIMLGNGIGAFVVRELTIRGTDLIARFAYLKNGAMYSIGTLGFVMILESLGHQFPFWLAPLNTIIILGLFLYLSWREIKLAQ